MRNLIVLGISLFCFFSASASTNITKLIGGNYFDGENFITKDLYIIDGKFSNAPTEDTHVVKEINLSGKFIIPPFGDAHTHNFDRQWQLPALKNQNMQEGVFYAWLLTNKSDGAMQTKDQFNNPKSMDLKYANAGITSTLGHPFLAYEPFMLNIFTPEDRAAREDELFSSRLDENNSYIFIDDIKNIDKKWEVFKQSNPDLVKIYILNVKNRAAFIEDKKVGEYGLDETIASAVIRKAKEDNLPVIAHIETSDDFRIALKLGVDGLAHMPGYGWDGDLTTKSAYYLNDLQLQKAADMGVFVIPTLSININYSKDESEQNKSNIKEFQSDFLRRFHQLGGVLMVGSDAFNQTMSQEISYFNELGVFDHATLLKILTIDTPQKMFTDRKLGRFETGFEASFLVLEKNPIKDFTAIRNISDYYKQGLKLDL